MKLVQLNIEMQKHFDKFLPWIKQQQADVICIQEVFDDDLAMLEKELGMQSYFLPMVPMKAGDNDAIFGCAIFTNLVVKNDTLEYYYVNKNNDRRTNGEKTMHRGIVVVEVEKGNQTFTIGTTHFTWTGDGQPDDQQRADLKALLKLLEKYPNLVIAGDFNAPRPGEIADELAKHLTDNIPPEIDNSLDPKLHRKPGLKRMVDFVWSKGNHKVTNVQMHEGLSDHQGISTTLSTN
ncbi:hypothetical protein CMO91_06470 [Candidatus Woesearchaeota archaeon]|nr:hypothetical protein [Candidatus Woesearchaeota archaeon]|tara:strand:+ start:42 stop:746 length:705 start_codon:yes stop_codon:yes gene_type:complete